MQLRFLVDTCTDMISRHDALGTFLYVSASCLELTGYSPEELLGHRSAEFMHADDVTRLGTFSNRPDVFDFQYRLRCKDDTYKWVESRSRIVRGASDRADVHEIHAFTRDVTDQINTERQLQDSVSAYRQLFEANPSPMWIYDDETLAILEVNSMASLHYGYSREEFLSMTLRDMRSKEDNHLLDDWLAKYPRGLHDAGVWRHIKRDGSIVEAQVVASDVEWKGRPARLALIRDVTAVRKSERDLLAYRDRLQKSEQGLHAAQAIAHIGSWDIDMVANHGAWTDELYNIYGLRREDFQSEPGALWQFDHPDDADDVRRHYEEACASRTPFNIVHRLVRRDGTVRWVHEIGKFEYDGGGEPVREVGTIQDITERKLAEDKLAFLAHFDPLTGLPNRVLLEDRLLQNMARARREKTLVAVLYLDLDNFQDVNDSLGRSYGDLLLQYVSEALKSMLRDSGTVCRHGSDEFVILVNDLATLDDVARVAHSAAKSISGLRSVEGRMLHASASIGISVFPNDGQDSETLIKYASVAMYQAKSEGRHSYRFYQPDMQKAVNRRLAVEADLRHALEQDQLRLLYQPIVELATGRIIAAEALLRWQHPDRGLLAPGEFVSVAEETGMIVPIGRWVLGKAAADAVAWHNAGIEIDVNVNVSPRQFREPDLDQQVGEAIRASGIAPERLHLEITESLLMDQRKALDITLKLKQLGVKIDLDDFGTGYSSLGRITDFPIDGLKVDRSFVAGLGNDDRSGVIAQAIVDLARSLGISVVAEGIETSDQLRLLRKFGCAVGQGYLFSKPVMEAAFRELFLKEQARLAG
jgi:diguanylate cyclase (GGDEF)-like protein/PAS domain S-box-containing protein